MFWRRGNTSLTRYEDEVIIKIKLEQFICSSTMGTIIVSIWCLISLITNWSDFKSRSSKNRVGESQEKGHKKTKVKVRIVFSAKAFTRRARRTYGHAHTHHIFYLKIGTVYSLTLIVTRYMYSYVLNIAFRCLLHNRLQPQKLFFEWANKSSNGVMGVTNLCLSVNQYSE